MARLTPGANLKVDNTLQDDGSQMAVSLKFRSMDDFAPAAVVDQVPALKKLLETRNQLRDLMTKVDRSEDLEKVLERVLQSTDDLKQMGSALGVDAPAGDSGKKEG
jgi:type VI secretion system protein ImpB